MAVWMMLNVTALAVAPLGVRKKKVLSVIDKELDAALCNDIADLEATVIQILRQFLAVIVKRSQCFTAHGLRGGTICNWSLA